MTKFNDENRAQVVGEKMKKNVRVITVFGHGARLPVHVFMHGALLFLTVVLALPSSMAQEQGWDFVYNGNRLPQTIIDQGGENWQPREGETNGRPKYERIKFRDAQIGGVWSRIDDNSEDPNAPGASNWARGYLFATNIYDQWTGEMTLVMRIKDLGTDSQKSVVDIMNRDGDTKSNYWTLGHVAPSDAGPAGWEYGQTDDGRNGNGLSDVRTGGYNQWVVIRIVIIDNDPDDGRSLIRAWQNGALVYESERTDDISVGQFGEIAFRRTSGGSSQMMEIDWVRVKFGAAWTPGEGEKTPAGAFDGQPNFANLNESPFINGVVGLDTEGVVRTVHGRLLNPLDAPLFQVDQNGVPTHLNMFYLGFDVYRDMELVGNSDDTITGVMLLDKFAGVHTLSVPGEDLPENGPGSPYQFDYLADVIEYNQNNPDDAAILPYFPFNLPIHGAEDGVARDMELAIDWRSATNAFQGYYILDAFAGVHYVNNPQIMNLVANNPDGIDKFFDIFQFKPVYRLDYAGVEDGTVQTKLAPYFLFAGEGGFPIARDLEIMPRFQEITAGAIASSQERNDLAASEGIDVDALFQPIAIDSNRLDVSQPVYAPSAAVVGGYAILDGYGAVHTMVEDEFGIPIPAPWEDVATGMIHPDVDAPYFANPPNYAYDIAVDLEVMPNGGGYVILTRLGEVFVVNAAGKSAEDNFVNPGIQDLFPNLGFDAARSLKLIPDEDGKIVGMYVLDRFGTIHRAGNVPALPGRVLFFPNGKAYDLEVSPLSRPITGAAVVTAPN